MIFAVVRFIIENKTVEFIMRHKGTFSFFKCAIPNFYFEKNVLTCPFVACADK